MKNMRSFWVLVLSVVVCTITSSYSIDQLTILVENDPYQVNEKGEPFGAAIDVCKEIMKKVGLKPTMQVIPWARGYKQAIEGPNTLLILGARSEEREKLFKWLGPIDRDAIILYAKKGSGYHFTSLDDAKKVPKIGCVRGTVEDQLLTKLGFKNLDLSDDQINAMKKLMLGRVNLLPIGLVSVKAISESAGYSIDDLEQTTVIQDTKYYYLVSKDVSDATLAILQKALDDLKADGTFNALFVKNKQTVPVFSAF